MKKILIFSLVYYPRHVGGAEVAVKEITDRISPSDFSFDMVTLAKHDSRFEKIGNVNVYRVGLIWLNKTKIFGKFYKYLFPFTSFIKASLLHRKNNYDAVFAVMANYAGFGALFFKIFHPKVKLILNLQEGDPIPYIEKRVGIMKPLFNRIFRKADKIQAISSYLAKWAETKGVKHPVAVVPNGVDGNRFKIKDLSFKREEEKEKMGFSKDDILVITTSRLVKKNAVGDIISAMKFLPENVKLIIAGGGHLETELKLKVESLKLENRVKFTGYISHEELPKYLWISDVFARPSLSEGMGVSFVEAMSAGVPVVATRVGGIPDFLQDKKTGLFCGIGDPKDLAKKIEIYLRDINLRNEIIENARKMVEEKYDWDLIARDMKNKVFNDALGISSFPA